ncbi:divergent PAP2 family protein [Patescibacteria group bacterium]|nr:divergent PAP2 family protein [Patescibacteria group bacterium]
MYLIIILPIISGVFIAQTIKILTRLLRKEKVTWKSYLAYSGMPSGHAAMVVSLSTIIGLREGLDSAIFGLSFIFSFLVIRDAVGLRRYLGQHGRTLNILVKDLEDDKVLESHYPQLLERVGHTPFQVVVGGLIGFSVSVIGYYLSIG